LCIARHHFFRMSGLHCVFINVQQILIMHTHCITGPHCQCFVLFFNLYFSFFGNKFAFCIFIFFICPAQAQRWSHPNSRNVPSGESHNSRHALPEQLTCGSSEPSSRHALRRYFTSASCETHLQHALRRHLTCGTQGLLLTGARREEESQRWIPRGPIVGVEPTSSCRRRPSVGSDANVKPRYLPLWNTPKDLGGVGKVGSTLVAALGHHGSKFVV
jgi:hypothetical protein